MANAEYAVLRSRVAAANVALAQAGLVALNFGNVSGVDRAAGVMIIKASGSPCSTLRAEDTVAVRLEDGAAIGTDLRPSSDTPTHRFLYRTFLEIGGIAHTHSANATAWAQAGRTIPCLGTTHADMFRGAIPISRQLTSSETAANYEWNTGAVIAEAIGSAGGSPSVSPAVLVRSHGPFTWGYSPEAAVDAAAALEMIAMLATATLMIDPSTRRIDSALLARHFDRKHGNAAYYGQPTTSPGRDEG